MARIRLFDDNYKIIREHKVRCNKERVKPENKVYNLFKRI